MERLTRCYGHSRHEKYNCAGYLDTRDSSEYDKKYYDSQLVNPKTKRIFL